MKKVLILSCSTGMGHNSCGQAVAEYFEENGIQSEVRDSLDFITPGLGNFASRGHSWIYRHMPGLFRFGYRFSEKQPCLFGQSSPVYKFLALGAENLHTYIENGGFDTVICTHPFSGMVLTHVLRTHPMEIQTAYVATDYTFAPSTDATDLQHYFIPAKELAGAYIRGGIPADRIVPSGIPVRRQFEGRTDKADAKRLLGIRADSRHLLMACGSMGCGPMAKIVKRIDKSMTEDMEVSVICGTNKKLQKRLTRMCRNNSRIHIIGYTNQMPLYLDSADLYLTKPGGISVTEAAAKKLPMAFVNAVDGCESYNLNFFLNRGCAVTAPTPKKLVELCVQLLSTWGKRGCMEMALREYNQPKGAEAIFRELNGGMTHAQRKYG